MVSIIIPAHNAEMTIGKCIQSLQTQTYPFFELIVVDDGSTDRTEEIVKECADKDSRIKLIHQMQLGVGAARNLGIVRAKGEVICFVDSDDWVSPQFISELLEMFEPGILPIADVMRSDQAGSIIVPLPNGYMLSEQWVDEYLNGKLGRGILFSVCNKLFSADLIQKENIRFSEQLTVGEDMLFVLQYLCQCCEIRFSDKAIYHYEILKGSSMYSFRDYSDDYNRLLVELREILKGYVLFNSELLSNWAFDATVQVVTNPYISMKMYEDFCNWWDSFISSELFLTARDATSTGSKKRDVFYRLAVSGNTRAVYLLLKGFQKLKEYKRREKSEKF